MSFKWKNGYLSQTLMWKSTLFCAEWSVWNLPQQYLWRILTLPIENSDYSESPMHANRDFILSLMQCFIFVVWCNVVSVTFTHLFYACTRYVMSKSELYNANLHTLSNLSEKYHSMGFYKNPELFMFSLIIIDNSYGIHKIFVQCYLFFKMS